MDVEFLAASTLAFCTIWGLRLTVTFCFRIGGIPVLHTTYVYHVFYVHHAQGVEPGTDWIRNSLGNAKFSLQLLEGDSFSFRVDEQNNEKLKRCHGCKKCEGKSP
jgi:hypothetical protein